MFKTQKNNTSVSIQNILCFEVAFIQVQMPQFILDTQLILLSSLRLRIVVFGPLVFSHYLYTYTNSKYEYQLVLRAYLKSIKKKPTVILGATTKFENRSSHYTVTLALVLNNINERHLVKWWTDFMLAVYHRYTYPSAIFLCAVTLFLIW